MRLELNKKLILVLIIMAVGAVIWYLAQRSPAQNNVKPDYSVNRTIKDAGDSVTINFRQCTPDQRRIDVGLGSTFIVITGTRDDETCLLKFNTQLENPNGIGGTFVGCAV